MPNAPRRRSRVPSLEPAPPPRVKAGATVLVVVQTLDPIPGDQPLPRELRIKLPAGSMVVISSFGEIIVPVEAIALL